MYVCSCKIAQKNNYALSPVVRVRADSNLIAISETNFLLNFYCELAVVFLDQIDSSTPSALNTGSGQKCKIILISTQITKLRRRLPYMISTQMSLPLPFNWFRTDQTGLIFIIRTSPLLSKRIGNSFLCTSSCVKASCTTGISYILNPPMPLCLLHLRFSFFLLLLCCSLEERVFWGIFTMVNFNIIFVQSSIHSH